MCCARSIFETNMGDGRESARHGGSSCLQIHSVKLAMRVLRICAHGCTWSRVVTAATARSEVSWNERKSGNRQNDLILTSHTKVKCIRSWKWLGIREGLRLTCNHSISSTRRAVRGLAIRSGWSRAVTAKKGRREVSWAQRKSMSPKIWNPRFGTRDLYRFSLDTHSRNPNFQLGNGIFQRPRVECTL